MTGAQPQASVLVLAAFIRTDLPTIHDMWKTRIARLPASDAPSLATHGREVLEWVASSLEEHARREEPSQDLPGEESFSAARAIAELALLTETIAQLQPPSLGDVARDSLHIVIDAAIARSLARDTHESDRLRKRLRLATDVTLVGSWELDPRSDIVGADERSCELFGVDGEPTTVDALTSKVHPEDRERVRDGIARTLESGEPYIADCRTVRRDNGAYRWIAIAADTLVGHTPSPRLLGIVHDITDQRRAEEEHARVIDELSRAVHISEMFVGILSHDLRNPLSAILGGANLLTHDAHDEKSARILARVVSSGERMGRMIDQLLDFTRARLGEGIPLRRDTMDLAQLAQEVIDEAKAASPEFVLRLTVKGDPAGAWDRDRLSQILSNLVGNSLQHGQASGVVNVAIDGTDPDRVELTIENSGTIPPALIPVIFNPFRGTLQKLGKSRGLGLGLYVARQIALAHGGELGVESTTRDTVVFTLRLQRSAQAVTLSKQERVREEEMAAFERMAAPLSTTAVTARLFGAAPLHERVPVDHADIAERYAVLLDTALHRTVYRGQGEGLAQDLRALAERLGDLGAGPREVTELHARSLRAAVRGVTAAKTQALLSEGRLLALELMGNLTQYYRRRARGRTLGSERTQVEG
jgi:PAS domain S-box-containing protein